MGDVGGQGHVPILNALFDNEDFLADYVQRYATLSNTIFSCDRMIEVLDSMVNVIAPEMQRQVDRWGGTYAGWEANVQEVRNFILQRCNTTVIGGLEDCYDVTAYTLTIQIIGDGEILVQEIEISDADSPFTGTYFGGLPIDLVAQVADCGSFGGWEIVSGDATLSSVSDPITELIINGDATISVTFNTGTGLSEMNLVVEPEGAGTITLDGTEISTFPYSEEFEYNLEKTLSATANEWFEFEEWQSTDYDMTPNATASEITVNTCSAGTITAVFTELPHASLRVEVSPAGSGSVEMEGALLTGLPWTDVIAANVSYDFEAIPITDISVFDHWEINNNVITPNDLSALISLNLIEDDTLVAHFRILQREELQVRVQPEGAGTISMDGTNLELPFSENLLIDETYTFTTAPIDEWSTFIGWQLNNHTLSPNATSLAVSLDFVMPDELVALYNVIPHQPVTVLVEPPFAGTITFDDGVITMDNRTEVMAAQENIGFSAVPEEYFDFSHWEIKKGAIVGPVKEAATTMIFNEEPDTVIAHFTRQDLQWFVPNSFTPNGDGTNDVFKIYTNAQDPEYFEMRVFNRWGEVMFETNDADKAWEGDFKGGEYYLPDGLYTYYIKLKWIHAEQFEEVRGTILMYR